MIETIVTGNLDTGRSQRLMTALGEETKRQTILTWAHIREERLRGGNPLHQRTGHLERSTVFRMEQSPGIVTGIVAVGKEAPYGKVHEYGGTFTIREHEATSRRGNRFTVREHSATFPERSFMRAGLTDRADAIIAGMRKAALEAIG